MAELHKLENGNDLEITATPLRCAKYMKGMMINGTGEVYCAFHNGGFIGCIALQFNIIPKTNSILVGGLYVRPNSPKKTVLMLMQKVIQVAYRRKAVNLWMLARNDKNQKRQAYRNFGFEVSGLSDNNQQLLTTRTDRAAEHLGRLMKIKAGELWAG